VRSFVLGLSLVSLSLSLPLGACAGGSYVKADRESGKANPGEVNGRRFDFVSNKPEQDEWQIRLTGSSMWVSYARDAKFDRLGSINLTDQETIKLWDMIDELDIPHHKNGKKDEDEGYVSLQLKEAGQAGEQVLIHHVYISRASEDPKLLKLATYLQDLTEKYKKERPNF
jgi:hypothetical protein